MLNLFSFKNFKSFKDQIFIDFTAANNGVINILTIHGDNASGKSNIIEAFLFMKNLVLNSFKAEAKWNKIPLKKFKFDRDSKNFASSFYLTFEYKNNSYLYGFVLDEDNIKAEQLGKISDNKCFFSRYDEIILLEDLKKYKEMINGLSKKTLLLSFFANLKIEDIKNVYNWFKETEVLSLKNINYKEMLPELLIKELTENNLKNNSNFNMFLSDLNLKIKGIKIDKIISFEGNKYNIFTTYQNSQTGKKEYLPLSEESDGTLKIIYIYLTVQKCLKKGSTIFIDDLDAHLSSKFIEYIINQFKNKTTNPNNSQLIFTSQNTIQILEKKAENSKSYFVEKNSNKESNIYEFKYKK